MESTCQMFQGAHRGGHLPAYCPRALLFLVHCGRVIPKPWWCHHGWQHRAATDEPINCTLETCSHFRLCSFNGSWTPSTGKKRFSPNFSPQRFFCKSTIFLCCRSHPLAFSFGKIDTGGFDGVDDGEEGLKGKQVGSLEMWIWEHVLLERGGEGRGGEGWDRGEWRRKWSDHARLRVTTPTHSHKYACTQLHMHISHAHTLDNVLTSFSNKLWQYSSHSRSWCRAQMGHKECSTAGEEQKQQRNKMCADNDTKRTRGTVWMVQQCVHLCMSVQEHVCVCLCVYVHVSPWQSLQVLVPSFERASLHCHWWWCHPSGSEETSEQSEKRQLCHPANNDTVHACVRVCTYARARAVLVCVVHVCVVCVCVHVCMWSNNIVPKHMHLGFQLVS